MSPTQRHLSKLSTPMSSRVQSRSLANDRLAFYLFPLFYLAGTIYGVGACDKHFSSKLYRIIVSVRQVGSFSYELRMTFGDKTRYFLSSVYAARLFDLS